MIELLIGYWLLYAANLKDAHPFSCRAAPGRRENGCSHGRMPLPASGNNVSGKRSPAPPDWRGSRADGAVATDRGSPATRAGAGFLSIERGRSPGSQGHPWAAGGQEGDGVARIVTELFRQKWLHFWNGKPSPSWSLDIRILLKIPVRVIHAHGKEKSSGRTPPGPHGQCLQNTGFTRIG